MKKKIPPQEVQNPSSKISNWRKTGSKTLGGSGGGGGLEFEQAAPLDLGCKKPDQHQVFEGEQTSEAGSIPRGEASRLRSGDFRSAVLHVAIKLVVTSAESASGTTGAPEENSVNKAFK